jgi:hypothetical protein
LLFLLLFLASTLLPVNALSLVAKIWRWLEAHNLRMMWTLVRTTWAYVPSKVALASPMSYHHIIKHGQKLMAAWWLTAGRRTHPCRTESHPVLDMTLFGGWRTEDLSHLFPSKLLLKIIQDYPWLLVDVLAERKVVWES